MEGSRVVGKSNISLALLGTLASLGTLSGKDIGRIGESTVKFKLGDQSNVRSHSEEGSYVHMEKESLR